MGTYSRSSWRRVFEDGILIGWECSKCRSEYNKEQSLLRKKIKIGMRALGRYEKLYKNRCNGYYSVKNRKEIQRKVFEHYSNGTMKCAICGTTKKLCIDHVNHDGKEERSRLFGKTSASCGGHHFHKYLYEKGFPKGYRVLCMKCNLKYYADNVHIIIPRRFINDNKNKPKILKWYKEYLMELFKKESLNEDL
ncbi:MAG: hypothetical protein GWN01_05425 [Nitrosopumilaceae archaeon]|nr:hypothetical protein [Nitrosopumilaceae archaeon]NIU86786.1 hypothetical protein [Nitrosopumilaceae archaeon]NIX60986.1 hypothetical protein [Nitrosopumilaceae archaeon]